MSDLKIQELSFEEAMSKLDDIVTALSAGKLSLDEMVRLYEQGDLLSKRCLQLLDAYEARIETVEEV